ncbi:MAG: polyphosphate kinase 2 [Bacteroidetes bacterium]|nr:MAG: polyphosphate kinase 2 [Bacteroidota bacterium]TAG88727.1 MAG: polyphosphate kinase 2 [Bacteroidota bacterium]
MEDLILTQDELNTINSANALKKLLTSKDFNVKKILKDIKYEEELEALQIELVKMHQWVKETRKRIAIIFEGRDAAGKGGTISRFTQHLSPRAMRVVALPKPSEIEKGQWYFQRYIKELPNEGEIVFFDRSWYNRAVVEPAMDFCTQEQYQKFMEQVPEFENMLYQDGIIVIKFWFIIDKKEQKERINDRRKNPLKQWKVSPIDEVAQKKWDTFSNYVRLMLSKTHTLYSPWILVNANNKQKARLESIRYVLSRLDYDGKDKSNVSLIYDPKTISRYEDGYSMNI